MRVVAVDPGESRVGLAVSDESEALARPLTVLPGGSGAETRIAEAAQTAGAGRIVVGLAVGLDGSEGPPAAKARDLAQQLSDITGLPVELWDERFTTDLALRLRRDALAPARSRKTRAPGRGRRRPDDAEAAAVLLQSYLDRGPARR